VEISILEIIPLIVAEIEIMLLSMSIKKRVPPEAKIIGKNLKMLRKKARLTQEEVGLQLNVSFQQIQKYESGINRLPIEKLYALKYIYDVPYEYFFVGIEKFYVNQIS
jgi:DNA-binding transcriptional regulator YiaG